MPLSPSDKAPGFTLPGDRGSTVNLESFAGRKVVLYFYPKADTSSCTVEAQDFTRLKADFDAAGVTVIGVSRDPVKAIDKFQAKYDLGVQLATDEARRDGGSLWRVGSRNRCMASPIWALSDPPS